MVAANVLLLLYQLLGMEAHYKVHVVLPEEAVATRKMLKQRVQQRKQAAKLVFTSLYVC